MNDHRPLNIESMSVQWVHNLVHVRLNQALLRACLYCCNNTAARLSRWVWPADTLRPSFSSRQRAGCGGRDIFTAIVPRFTNRCKQSGDRFELANGAAWMNFGIRSEFTPKTKFGRTLMCIIFWLPWGYLVVYWCISAVVSPCCHSVCCI